MNRFGVVGLVFCMMVASFCDAQTVFVDIDNQTQNKLLEGYQTLPLPELKEIDFSDELFITAVHQIPAYGLYSEQWDSTHLRSVQLTLPVGEEGLKVILVGSYNSPFIYPCRGNVILHYGQQKKAAFHTGIDFQLNMDDLVYACFDGVVRMGTHYGDYGKTVVIRHYNGLETVYSHLNQIQVKTGQIIKAGHVIGLAGNTGLTNSKANHATLHFETRFLNEYFDPQKLFDIENRNLLDNTLLLTSRDFNITPIPQKIVVSPEASPEQKLEKEVLPETPSEETPETETSSVPSESSAQYHVIQQGETLYRISVKYNVSVDYLLKLNNIKSPDLIKAGQKLRIK